MTDKKIDQEDLTKALAALQDIAKGHSSGGTATTKVESMVGESGSSQLFHTASNSDPGGWAGSSWRGEGWEDSIDSNGTDLNSVKKLAKSIAKSIAAKLAKGESLSPREANFVVKGGMNFMAEKDDDKDDEKKVEKAHPDAAEDKKQIESMVKPGALNKSDVEKSLMDHARENASVSQGFEVAEFLSGWAQVMHKSLSSMEARITDKVLTAVAASHAEQATVSKSMAGALAGLGEVLSVQSQRINQIEEAPARGAKSTTTISKSGVVPSPADAPTGIESMNKSQVLSKLFDLVKKSEATAQDVVKYDSTGFLSDDLAYKIAGR